MIKNPLFKIRLTLFWRLFLSLLFTILFTALSSILIERGLNERALNTRMDQQIERLLVKRELVVAALQTGDMQSVRQLYQEDRRFMNQISIYNEQGALLFPKYNQRRHRKGKSHVNSVENPPSQNSITSKPTRNKQRNNNNVINTIINIDNLPKIADTLVTLPNGETLVIQLRPNLPFSEVVALQRGNFGVRLLLIILFSTLVCVWLSRTLIRRIRHVQNTVRQMINGHYQIDLSLISLGSDELGLLAKDVAKLASRLVESELARKQMLSDISHELRSPLARLEVATELTRDFAPNAERYLDRIDKESTRMNELIEQIIHIQSLQMQQYSTIDSEKEPINLIELISDISQDVLFEFQNKNVTLEWQTPTNEEEYLTFGNHKQLHSALENVIRNAFVHTPENSTVTVDIIKTKTNQASMVQIRIADEGKGIEDKDVQRIFEPFVRLDSARQRQTGGYGLGLAIAHAVMMAHKGNIQAYNRTDHQQGLVVKIELPFFVDLTISS